MTRTQHKLLTGRKANPRSLGHPYMTEGQTPKKALEAFHFEQWTTHAKSRDEWKTAPARMKMAHTRTTRALTHTQSQLRGATANPETYRESSGRGALMGKYPRARHPARCARAEFSAREQKPLNLTSSP